MSNPFHYRGVSIYETAVNQVHQLNKIGREGRDVRNRRK